MKEIEKYKKKICFKKIQTLQEIKILSGHLHTIPFKKY